MVATESYLFERFEAQQRQCALVSTQTILDGNRYSDSLKYCESLQILSIERRDLIRSTHS